jgi:hypothetical protein
MYGNGPVVCQEKTAVKYCYTTIRNIHQHLFEPGLRVYHRLMQPTFIGDFHDQISLLKIA